jgi:uncharacterized membrane protein YdjX (TVP38/TMEM64 family)
VNVGLTLAAMMSFLVSRYVCRDLVTARLGAWLERLNVALEREGAGYLFAGRIVHIPFCVTNYMMGPTRIRTSSFWWATQLGLLPGNIIFVYAGAQAPSIEEIAEHGFSSLVSPGLIVALVAMTVVPLLLRSMVRRIVVRKRFRHTELAIAGERPSDQATKRQRGRHGGLRPPDY